jgi:uroporphyrinogen decarboxylase
MTSREIVNSLLRGQQVERIGIYDHGPWSTTYERWVREGYPTTQPPDGSAARPAPYFEHFQYDMAPCGGWFDWTPQAGAREVVAETDEWIKTRNGAGAIIRNWKHQVSTPEFVEFRMTNREVWEKEYRPHVVAAGPERVRPAFAEMRKSLEKYRRLGYWTFYGNQFLWENMRNSMGNQCMLESLLLDPDWIHDYNRVYTDLYIRLFRAMIEEVGKPDGIWLYEDLAYKNGLVCSPKILRELIFPYYKELVQFFHSCDLPVILHSDGHIDDAIPLIIDAGFSAMNPMDNKAGCDTFKYGRQYGEEIAFIGGYDTRVLETGNRKLIEQSIVDLLEKARSGRIRYMFGPDHSVPPGVSYSDFQYALQVYREHMRY